MATIDSRLLEALEASTCFGIAHDETVPECMQCDVKAQCKKKSEGVDLPTPTTRVLKEEPVLEVVKPKSTPKTAPKKTETKKAAPAPKAKAETKKVTPSGNIPDFKSLALEELKDMAKERDVDWKDYGNDQITRMRLIMALKKTY